MSTIKTKNIKQTVISGTTQPLKIGGILEDGSDAKISIGSDGTTTVVGTGQLIAEYIVSGSAVTSIDIQNLDINTHKSYRIECEFANATATTSYISFYVNGDTTSSNYYAQSMSRSGTASGGGRGNNAIHVSLIGNSESAVYGVIGLVNGKYILRSNTTMDEGATIVVADEVVTKVASITNITQLTIMSSVANAIGVGSKVRIYRG